MLTLYGFSKPGAHHTPVPAVVSDDVTSCALGSLIACIWGALLTVTCLKSALRHLKGPSL